MDRNFEDFKVFCDPSSFEKLAFNIQFCVSIKKYWKSANEIQKAGEIRFNKSFQKFAFLEKTEKKQGKKGFKTVFRSKIEESKIESLKNRIIFGESEVSKITMKYVQNRLWSAKIWLKSGEKIKIKGKDRPASKNKNQESYDFRVSRNILCLMPIFSKGELYALVVKYGREKQTIEQLKENENDVLVPSVHPQILASIKNLKVRIDISYFLKSEN